ncbi:DUF6401 family natural product biosynthesis protein [Nocardia stercoris]|uniref:Uncharacterized protein n=1 Tax=Nocardia stercoris TaxID=2483361 RepID=A0A3M2LCW9_9NOCA|nr:DUF6401 family natural product biosynthesis protein [Nocardia stercoris]RMI34936.1 hypothetical protein EBN03_00785 [Nocardia stercoris]
MFQLNHALLEVSARKTLNRLDRSHGVPAYLASREFPSLSAELDQHSAAVRDIVEAAAAQAATTPPLAILAGYARGLLDEAGRPGLISPQSRADWARAGWLQLRLAGVCQVAAGL